MSLSCQRLARDLRAGPRPTPCQLIILVGGLVGGLVSGLGLGAADNRVWRRISRRRAANGAPVARCQAGSKWPRTLAEGAARGQIKVLQLVARSLLRIGASTWADFWPAPMSARRRPPAAGSPSEGRPSSLRDSELARSRRLRAGPDGRRPLGTSADYRRGRPATATATAAKETLKPRAPSPEPRASSRRLISRFISNSIELHAMKSNECKRAAGRPAR